MKNLFKIFTSLLLLFSLLITVGCNQKDTSTTMMPQVDKLLTFWNTGNFEGIEDVLCEDFEIRMSPLFEPEKGIDAFKESVLSTRKSYPDFRITIDETLFSGTAGAGRWTIHATSRTGKAINIPGMSILHFKDGKIKDEWISNNDLLWLKQLNYNISPPAVDTK
jgi:ketosteroid isomerase-like protein